MLERALRSARRRSPGATGAVIVDGELVWSGVDGLADRMPRQPVQEDTLFSLASLTKPYTAALILRLVQRGALGLDDPAHRHLGDRIVAGAGAVTIRQLLEHSAGLPEYLRDAGIRDALRDRMHPWTTDELLRAVGPPMYKPGRRFRYSNADYIVLGAIAAEAGGAPTGELMRREVLEPLGLTDTFLQRRTEVLDRVARGHRGVARIRPAFDGPVPTDVYGEQFTDGGIVATAADAARFLDGLLGGRLLEPQLLEEMCRPGANDRYGLGLVLRKRRDGTTWRGHPGAYGGYACAAYGDGRTTAAILLNRFSIISGDRALERLVRAQRRS